MVRPKPICPPLGAIIILGDFNVDTLNVNRSLDVPTFIDNFKCEHLESLINLPTHKKHHSETCLDHIYVNIVNTCPSGVIELAVSDHQAHTHNVITTPI